MGENSAVIAISLLGFVDGVCITPSPDVSNWIAEMRHAGMVVARVPRDKAKELLFSNLAVPAVSSAAGRPDPGRMIVARRTDGIVEAAGWDYGDTRATAREWLNRGLTLEFVSAEQVAVLAAIYPDHVFGSTIPVGDVLTNAQAIAAFDGY